MLYIDPGTGSMLFTILIGLVSAVVFALKDRWIRMKTKIGGGKNTESSTKIDYVIFSDDKRYWNVFGPICDEFEHRKIECHYMTASEDDPALDEKYEYVKCEFIGKGNKPFIKLNSLNASVLLATTPGLDVYQWRRSKKVDYYIHTYHTVGACMDYRMFSLDFYDAVLATGNVQEEYVRKIETIRNLNKKDIEIVGCTYLDAMSNREKVSKNTVGDNITVLIASTWGENGILSRYGELLITNLLQCEYNVIVRPHPQSLTSDKKMLDALMENFPESDRLHWNFDNDNFDALSKSDVMISDYSGVVYDYCFVFDKPFLYSNNEIDMSCFEEAWLDEPSWNFQTLSMLGKEITKQNIEKINEYINEVIHNDIYAENRMKLREEVWAHRGEAAVRTVDYMIKKHDELLEVVRADD